jgi:hypothetical protein
MINIEKNVPAPSQQTGRPRKYPFPSMEVGDSFAIPLQGIMTPRGDKATAQVTSAAVFYARMHGMKFSIRTDNENNVVRCWRVA